MNRVFARANSQTAKKTLAIFLDEIKKDKKTIISYGILIPLNRLLYIVILPLLFSLIIQSLILHPHELQYPLTLLVISVVVSILAAVTAYIGFGRLFVSEEKMRTKLLNKAMDNLMHHSDQFFASRKVGSLAGDVSTFSSSILSFLDIIFLQASGIVVNFAASLIVIAFLSPVLLLPLGLATGLLVWRSIHAVTSRGPLRHERKRLTSQLSGTIADILGNLQIVRYFAMNKAEMKRIEKDRSQIVAIAGAEINVIQRETLSRQVVLFRFHCLALKWLHQE